MARPKPEPVQVVKQRRDAALAALAQGVPYSHFLGIRVARRGDELTTEMPYDEKLIGNPFLPALHGGAIASFLEIAALMEISWAMIWEEVESGQFDPEAALPRLPKTIGFTVDYLRTGLPRDAYARARVVRSGRRYATVQVEAWQDNRDRPFAQGTAHFLMPQVRAEAPVDG